MSVSGGRAHLLVQKTLDHNARMPWNFAQDAPINVTLVLANVGDAAATAVVVEDSWASGFELSGSTGVTQFDEIPAGATVVASYFVTPSVEGPFESKPARVSYKPSADAEPVTAFSSSATNLNVISAETFARQTNTHVVEYAVATALFALFVLAPAAKWYDLSSSYVKGGRRKAE